ncbi:S9 family peptidase [Liquorilactobacillus oeni]|uniref:Dipeptidyl aminopeptidase acylaminoacyl-peptidase n=1 Tax=Liquorilactobacillus oeni DSM 19972 TaxID=1423777 RepID=A0A0R1MJ82_9LACO|nr:S9 family peptidase [Liquorilactobacillus oeni]KRL04547.1 dipeptidyl aminopeptidase acylaminoacyl-peptidase [Liquorilactobacillus oeni DSM 19972]
MNKTVQIKDLYHFDSLASPQYNSKGNKVLYVQTKVTKASDNYLSEIRLYDLITNEDHGILKADSLNIEPLWATADTGFYFISNKDGARQIYYYDFDAKTVKQLTSEAAGIKDFMLHPDGAHILYLTQAKKVEPGPAFTTTRACYKFNGHGLLEDDDHLRKLWLQGIDSSKKVYLAAVNFGFSSRKAFTISPDGLKIVFEKKLAEDDDFNFDEGLWQLTLNEELTEVVKNENILKNFAQQSSFSNPCFSQNGRYLGFLGNEGTYNNAKENKFFVYDTKEEQLLTFSTAEELHAADSCVTDFHQNNTNPLLQWNEAKHCFVFIVSQKGKVCLYTADPAKGMVAKLTDRKEHIQDFAVDPVSGNIALVVSRPELPAGLFVEEFGKAEAEELKTKVLEQQRDYTFAEYQTFEFTHSDGGKIPCFFALPPLFSGKEKIPLVLDIHGGPHAMHGYTFHHEVQVLAAKGMAVLLVNPRGSFGYGQKHADGVVGNYGKGDYEDLMIAVDQIIKKFPEIDQDSLFVTGGSYGGFMTNWVVAHTDRFKRAATQRSISNFVSMSGTSDIGYWFNTSEAGGVNILKPQKLWEESPLAYINNVKTPTLILHSDQDLRCPLEQGEQWFVALKTLGVETKFIRFFGESHELSRSGKPSNRIKRLSEIVACFTDEDYFAKK